MNLGRKSQYTTLVVLGLVFLGGVQSSNAWSEFVRTNELFAVGQLDSEKSYLYKIDPLTGDLRLIGDTGLNNCTGLDFTPEGKLKVFCELREDGEVDNRNGVAATPGVTAELDPSNGGFEWAVPHGVSNSISDISINDSGELFSYENIETERIHKHLEENDFFANLVGETGIKAQDHAIAFWADGKLKMATNTEKPCWYSINTETGIATKMGELSFPDSLVAAAGITSQRIIKPEDIVLSSMDSVEFNTRVLEAFNTRAGVYAFVETDADFVVLMNKLNGIDVDDSNANREFELDIWAAVGLLESEANQVDFIVEIQGDVDVTAIAVRRIEPRPIPTMSEWGLIITASSLFVLAVIILVRRSNSART